MWRLIRLTACGVALWGGGLGAQAPGDVAVFAPGVVTVEGKSLYRGSFSADGQELYFFRKVTEGQEDYRIFMTRRDGDGWTSPEQVDLGGDYSDLYPTISPDGDRMVFSSYRPTPEGPSRQANLWYADRDGDGWGDPVYMAAPSDREAYNPGPMYRSDGYVYYKRETWGPDGEIQHLRTRWTGDGFSAPERDPTLDPFADWGESVRIWNGVPSPNARLMVLEVSELDPASGRPRPTDLWVAVRSANGWSEPRRLPDAVNSDTWEGFTVFSPDGETLLFGRGFTSLFTVPVAALQEPGAASRDGAASRPDVRGTFVLDGERVVSIYDLRDFMPDGRSQLNFVEPTSGRLRTLRPVVDGWTAGPAWFVDEPVAIRVAVAGEDHGRATRLQWVEGGDTLRARRVELPTRPVRFASKDATLAGTLILPPDTMTGDGPFPAMVTVHGSGRATREVPRYIGELFARAGVATLVYDKRGTGESSGDFGAATVADFAADAAAAVKAAMEDPAIDASRVGVMVASQGGLLVPRIVEENPDVAVIVCRVCPVLPGGETSIAEARGRLALVGLPDSAGDAAASFLRAQQRYARTGAGYDAYVEAVERARGTAWAEAVLPGLDAPMAPDAPGWRYYRDFIAPDPWAVYERFDGPVLGIFGELDERIPRELQAEPLRDLLARTGHPASEVWVLDDATHGLLVVEPDGDRRGPFRRVPPGWHDRLVEWVRARLDAGPGGGTGPEHELPPGMQPSGRRIRQNSLKGPG